MLKDRFLSVTSTQQRIPRYSLPCTSSSSGLRLSVESRPCFSLDFFARPNFQSRAFSRFRLQLIIAVSDVSFSHVNFYTWKNSRYFASLPDQVSISSSLNRKKTYFTILSFVINFIMIDAFCCTEILHFFCVNRTRFFCQPWVVSETSCACRGHRNSYTARVPRRLSADWPKTRLYLYLPRLVIRACATVDI